MSFENSGEGISPIERVTSPRFSLASELIGSSESVSSHPVGTIRILSYPTPSTEQLEVRDKLLEGGLIVGGLISDEVGVEQAYRIPKSARPLRHDSSDDSEGLYSYNDEQLFFDLGELLATASKLLGRNKVISADIGQCLALVEFVKPGERHLYFVPGIEKLITEKQIKTSPLYYYFDKVKRAYGDMFDARAMQSFHMGYNEAQA